MTAAVHLVYIVCSIRSLHRTHKRVTCNERRKKKKKSVNVPLSSSARASPLSTLYTTLVFGSTFDGNVSAAALIQVCNDPIAVRAVTPPINQTCPVCAFVYVSVRARVD